MAARVARDGWPVFCPLCGMIFRCVVLSACAPLFVACIPDENGGDRVKHAEEQNRLTAAEVARSKAAERAPAGWEKKVTFPLDLENVAFHETTTKGGECFSVRLDLGSAGAPTGKLESSEFYVKGPEMQHQPNGTGPVFLTDSLAKVGELETCVLRAGSVHLFTEGKRSGTGTGILEVWSRPMPPEEQERLAERRSANIKKRTAQIHEYNEMSRRVFTCEQCKSRLRECVTGVTKPTNGTCGKDFYSCADSALVANGKKCI